MARNNYNSLAPYYDFISRLIYGNNILTIQKELIQYIQPDTSILIIGGGNGKILTAIQKLSVQNLRITYVEASSKMVALSKKNAMRLENIQFITAYIEDVPFEEKFDYILTPFFFDNFPLEKIHFLLEKLNKLLKSKGIWLYADFNIKSAESNKWHSFLLKTMYIFFKIVSQIETQKLEWIQPIFEKNGYTLEKSISNYRNFIIGQVYKKA